MKFAKHSNLAVRNCQKFVQFNYSTLFVTFLQKKGMKKTAFKIVSDFFVKIKQLYLKLLRKYKITSYEFFKKVFDYYCPKLGFKKKYVAGKLYMLPIPIRPNQRKAMFLRWFIKAARSRTENTLLVKLINEFSDIRKGVGKTVRKLEEYYNVATQNRPFLRYARKKPKYGRYSIKILKKFKL